MTSINQRFQAYAELCVEKFDLDRQNYRICNDIETKKFDVRNINNNLIYSRDAQLSASVNLTFHDSRNCLVFLGRNLTGNITANIWGSNTLIYIGDDCCLNSLEIRSFQSNDTVVVGNGVTTTAKNTWISGNGAGDAVPAIIIGDDCMFSYDCVIRNSDAHPIFSRNDGVQVNSPSSAVIIEPHVWIGERAAILKDVVVGACSIIALGAVVTKNVPRHSVARGVPAISTVNPDLYWARSHHGQSKLRALYFADKYPLKDVE